MRTIFIGDIHGCFDELQLMLKKVEYSKSDRLILLGDLINKGPKSLEVLRFVKEENIEFILGNHEYGFMKYIQSGDNHIDSFNRIKEQMGDGLEEWMSFLESKPFYIKTDQWIAVHGGLSPESCIEETDGEFLCSVRLYKNRPWFDFYKGKETVFFGHWAKLGLFIKEKVICLDTRCCYGGSLSAYIWEEKKLVQIKALKEYCKITVKPKA